MNAKLSQRAAQEIVELRRRIAQLEPMAIAYERMGKLLDLVNLQRGGLAQSDVLQELIIESEAQERAAQAAAKAAAEAASTDTQAWKERLEERERRGLDPKRSTRPETDTSEQPSA